MLTKNIKQTVIFEAKPPTVFELLMDSKKHSDFTESKASIGRKVGDKFTAYGNYIAGENLEIIENKKIVQKWRASDWPLKHSSIVTFTLEPLGTGTRLTFSQIGVPQEQYKDLDQGWNENYWQKMKSYLKTKK